MKNSLVSWRYVALALDIAATTPVWRAIQPRQSPTRLSYWSRVTTVARVVGPHGMWATLAGLLAPSIFMKVFYFEIHVNTAAI